MPTTIINLAEAVAADAAEREAAERQHLAMLAEVQRVLVDGGLVIFPTESFYGIAARADSAAAVAAVVSAKGREAGTPLGLVAARRADAEAWIELPGVLAALADALWPGPLTLVARVKRPVPAALCNSEGGTGVRVPDHLVAQAVAHVAGGVITATSANLAGGPPVTRVADLDPRLLEHVAVVLDAGELPGAQPSTVLGLRDGKLQLFREGAITRARIAALVPAVEWCS